MSYLTYSMYAGSGCTAPFASNIQAVANCSVVESTRGYRNCTTQSVFTPGTDDGSVRIDCVSATSADKAFRQVIPDVDFSGTVYYNGTTCSSPSSPDTTLFYVLNKCVTLLGISAKATVNNNLWEIDAYTTTTCDGASTVYQNYTVGTCYPATDSSFKVSTYSANSGSSSKLSWGLVFAVVLSQLL